LKQGICREILDANSEERGDEEELGKLISKRGEEEEDSSY